MITENYEYSGDIEKKVFRYKRFSRTLMEKYGFINVDSEYYLRKDFMNGDFTACISVDKDGSVAGKVFDNMNDEEYMQLRMAAYNGSYVNSVRTAYEELLREIAAECCTDADFASDQGNRIAGLILEKYGVTPDFPWTDRYNTYGVFRHPDTAKWFGLVMNIDRGVLEKAGRGQLVDVINLKLDAEGAGDILAEAGIYPAYHMNHKTWISVLLNDTLTDDRIMELVDDSFRLTAKKPGKMDKDVIFRVLDVADNVPAGCVVTYGQIAQLIGREKNSRMVGKILSMADRYGDHPCHRVVNHQGRTVPGWFEQRALLEAEGIEFNDKGRVDLRKYQWKPEPEELERIVPPEN